MAPGRWLHRLAVRSCSLVTREQIIEPLLSDLQHQWFAAGSGPRRARTLFRGYAAFWQTLVICGVQATARAVVTAPARITFERAFVGLYAIAIFLVILFGATWVRTGTLNPIEGLITIRGLIGLFVPGFVLSRSWPLVRSWRSRVCVLSVFVSVTACVCAIYPGSPLQLALYNGLYLCLFTWRRPYTARDSNLRA